MRRHELEIKNRDEVISILENCQSLVLGMIDTSGNTPIPYTVPLNFSTRHDKENQLKIYFHCAKDGRKMDLIEKNKNVCFSAILNEKISDGDHPDQACHWTTKYKSIFGKGIAEILYGPQQPHRPNETNRPEGLLAIVAQDKIRHAAMDALMKKSGFIGKPEYSAKTMNSMPIVEITVTEITGKSR